MITIAIDLNRAVERVYALAALTAVGSESIVKTPILGRNEKAALMAVAEMTLTETVDRLHPYVSRTAADDETELIHLEAQSAIPGLTSTLEQLTALRTYGHATAAAALLHQADARTATLCKAFRLAAIPDTIPHLAK